MFRVLTFNIFKKNIYGNQIVSRKFSSKSNFGGDNNNNDGKKGIKTDQSKSEEHEVKDSDKSTKFFKQDNERILEELLEHFSQNDKDTATTDQETNKLETDLLKSLFIDKNSTSKPVSKSENKSEIKKPDRSIADEKTKKIEIGLLKTLFVDNDSMSKPVSKSVYTRKTHKHKVEKDFSDHKKSDRSITDDETKKLETDLLKSIFINDDSTSQPVSKYNYERKTHRQKVEKDLSEHKKSRSIVDEEAKKLETDLLKTLFVDNDSMSKPMSKSEYERKSHEQDLSEPKKQDKLIADEEYKKLETDLLKSIFIDNDNMSNPVSKSEYESEANAYISKSFLRNPSGKALNIFTKEFVSGNSSNEHDERVNIMDIVDSNELKQLAMVNIENEFSEMIYLTKEKRLWNFPIDNEQDSEELNVSFHEHVFPQQYLTGRLPTTGIIGQFMNLVIVGLSKNYNLTVAQKKAHILWYEEYLSTKSGEIEAAMAKAKEDQKFVESVRKNPMV